MQRVQRFLSLGSGLRLLPVVLAAISAFCELGVVRADVGLRFHAIKTAAAMSGQPILKLAQDRQGLIWAGTKGAGLWRFDGRNWQSYARPGASTARGAVMRALAVDPVAGIWVGDFNGGLDFYAPGPDSLDPVRRDDFDGVAIWSLLAADDGWIWVGTYDRGVARFRSGDGPVQWFAHQPSNPRSLVSDRVNALYQDGSGTVWLGTGGGLERFDSKRQVFIHYPPQNSAKISVQDIYPGKNKRLWVLGSHQVYTLTSAAGHLSLVPSPRLPRGQVFSALAVDDSDWVWLAAPGSGLYSRAPRGHNWRNSTHSQWGIDDLTSSDQRSLLVERSGLLLAGGGGGINVFSRGANAFKIIRGIPEPQRSGSTTGMELPWFAGDGSLWVARPGEIVRFNTALQAAGRWRLASPDSDTRLQLHMFALGQLAPGTLRLAGRSTWVDFQLSSGQLTFRNAPHDMEQAVAMDVSRQPYLLLDSRRGLIRLTDPPTMIAPAQIVGSTVRKDWAATDMRRDHSGNLWVATTLGLFWQSPDGGGFRQVDWRGAGDWPAVRGISETDGRLWSVTNAELAAVLPTRTGYIARPVRALSNAIAPPLLHLIAGEHGDLWIVDAYGLLRFKPKLERAERIAHSLVMRSLDIAHEHGVVARDGRIAVGAVGRVVVFDPKDLRSVSFAPDTMVSGATVLGDRSRRISPSGLAKGLELGYRDRMVTFDLAVLGFDPEEEKRVRYKLDGFDQGWIDDGWTGSAVYTNLDPGKYRFVAQGAMGSGAWGQISQPVSVAVHPAWWVSNSAYASYVLVALLTFYLYWRSLTTRLARQQQISEDLREANQIKQNFVDRLEQRVQAATAELRDTVQTLEDKNVELATSERKAQQASDFKSRFLANISHDLRTPLTGLLGHLELLCSSGLDRDQGHYVKTVQRSADDLLSIVNDLLDVSKIEAGKLEIESAAFRIRLLLDEVLEVLAVIAERKGIALSLQVDPEVPEYLIGDALRIKQVIANLVGNALKFTEHGSIKVAVRSDGRNERGIRLAFCVSDTGIGIPEDAKRRLFQAFVQGDVATTRRFGGTGLGLTICKRLCELMSGDLSFTSEYGHGSTFSFDILAQIDSDAQPRNLMAGCLVQLFGDQSDSRVEIANLLQWHGADVQTHSLDAGGVQARRVGNRNKRVVLVLSPAQIGDRALIIGFVERYGADCMWIFAPLLELKSLADVSQQYGVPVLPVRGALSEIERILRDVPDLATQDVTASELDGRGVLVADDDEVVRLFLSAVLTRRGARVTCASHGAETLRVLENSSFDFVLLDMEMPQLHGMDVVTEIRKHQLGGRELIVVGLSGQADPEFRRTALAAGLDDFLCKPVTAEQLERVLKRLLPETVPV